MVHSLTCSEGSSNLQKDKVSLDNTAVRICQLRPLVLITCFSICPWSGFLIHVRIKQNQLVRSSDVGQARVMSQHQAKIVCACLSDNGTLQILHKTMGNIGNNANLTHTFITLNNNAVRMLEARVAVMASLTGVVPVVSVVSVVTFLDKA